MQVKKVPSSRLGSGQLTPPSTSYTRYPQVCPYHLYNITQSLQPASPLPGVSLSLSHLTADLTTTLFTLPQDIQGQGYLTALSWTSVSTLTFTWVSKNQNLTSFITCKVETITCKIIQTALFPTIGELGQMGHFSDTGQEIVFIGSLQVDMFSSCKYKSDKCSARQSPHSGI